MNDNILDTHALDKAPQNFDAKTITRINDAKIEANDHLRRMLMGRWVLVVLVFLNVFSLYVTFESVFNGISSGVPPDALSPAVVAGVVKVIIVTAIFTVLPLLVFAIIFRINPVLFLALALGFYLFGQLITLLTAGAWAVVQGYGLKAAVVTALAVPLYSGIRWRQQVKRLRTLGVPKTELEVMTQKLKPLRRTKRPKK